MGDVFKEYLVKHVNNPKERLQQAGLWAGAVLIGLVCFSLPYVNQVAIMIFILLMWGAYILNRRFRKEFEYVITNGDLDVDVILAQNKRKNVINIHIKDFQLMVPSESKEHLVELNKVTKVIDASEGGNSKTYSAIFEKGGQIVRLIWSPSEDMLKTVKTYAPRQTILRP